MSQFDTPFAKAVASLGETPKQVSEALQARGIKGYRQIASRCPIAHYLNACGFPHVTVATYAHRYSTSKAENAEEMVSLPKVVKDWIYDFDNGKYPEFYQEP